MNVVREIERINEEELRAGISESASWHARYRSSAWVYVGGLSSELTEGDVVCVFSQWGEIEDVVLVRDEETGKSKGFAFIKYEDQRSTVLAVDNGNGAKLLGRTLRVDHKLEYQAPKKKKDRKDGYNEDSSGDDDELKAHAPGHAYAEKELASGYSISRGVDVFAAPEPTPEE
eukprot:CAMPEP_0203817618 /NCGR_PEP_ID=MMETSP0115-20131106/27240_1 /ASSEMBLY_ACC=CAM_ASM_000227 /TAXON_ID=33651 /ORGANISM="Bicosoecid sp, Strain ms1" /LENGTH=172 /DNA_ID=CAMNT_0050726559 /DNA_START=75 /DNA_END=590 /DNA_ORIENTATION=+